MILFLLLPVHNLHSPFTTTAHRIKPTRKICVCHTSTKSRLDAENKMAAFEHMFFSINGVDLGYVSYYVPVNEWVWLTK